MPLVNRCFGSSGSLCRHSGEWRNWQTRRIQVPVSERMWGFKSPLAHLGVLTKLACLRRQNSVGERAGSANHCRIGGVTGPFNA